MQPLSKHAQYLIGGMAFDTMVHVPYHVEFPSDGLGIIMCMYDSKINHSSVLYLLR